MSIYKGSTKIAGLGADGRPGPGGQRQLIIQDTQNEIHNGVNEAGQVTTTNYIGNCMYSSVGGYNCSIVNGSQNFIHGRNCTIRGADDNAVFGYDNHVVGYRLFAEGSENSLEAFPGCHVEGYQNTVTLPDTNGAHIEGYKNTVSANGILQHGAHVEGYENTIPVLKHGAHIEGFQHSTFLPDVDGGHQGGYGVNTNSTRPTMPPTTVYTGTIEVVGGHGHEHGDIIREMDIEGNMGIAGDFSFVAKESDGTVIGTYTLGQIVKALIDANILNAPL